MFDIRHESALDISARENLLDRCFGESRFAKTSERLREGRLPAEGLALAATQDGALVGTIRLWNVAAGPGHQALLLGPVAIEPALQGVGLGARLVREGLTRAVALGHQALILVGDAPYYGRFGFAPEPVGGLWLPGPWERNRFLGLELVSGALAGARGMVSPTGRTAPRPALATLVAEAANEDARRRWAA